MKLIEVIADAGHSDTIQSIAEHHNAVDVWWGSAQEDGRRAVRLMVRSKDRQAVLDALQGILSGAKNARILVLPVEAVLPRSDQTTEPRAPAATTREELYDAVARGASLERNFLTLVMLSTVVAAIGLMEDSVAVVIGAMVIAPLLGPNLALALATALGDLELMGRALKSNFVGIALAFAISAAIGYFLPPDALSNELLARARVDFDSVALALASGAAAALSLMTGVSTVLVGVMVAVALLPPTAAIGIFAGAGYPDLATGAGVLLAINIVSVNLAAKLVFLAKGVKPRGWLDKRTARQSMAIYLLLWGVTLVVLVIAISLRAPGVLPATP